MPRMRLQVGRLGQLPKQEHYHKATAAPTVLLTQCSGLLEVPCLKPIGLVKLILHRTGLRQSGLNLFSALNLDFMANLATHAFEQSSMSLNTANPFRGFQWGVKNRNVALIHVFLQNSSVVQPSIANDLRRVSSPRKPTLLQRFQTST